MMTLHMGNADRECSLMLRAHPSLLNTNLKRRAGCTSVAVFKQDCEGECDVQHEQTDACHSSLVWRAR